MSDRKNYSQNWCIHCNDDDVTYKKSTNQLFCDSCGNVDVMTANYGLEAVVEETARLLPDLAKEAFLSAQETSFRLKVRKSPKPKKLLRKLSSEFCVPQFLLFKHHSILKGMFVLPFNTQGVMTLLTC